MTSTKFVRNSLAKDNGTQIRGIVQKKRGKGKALPEFTCNNRRKLSYLLDLGENGGKQYEAIGI